MGDLFLNFIVQSKPIVLFLVIGLGYLLGHLRFFGAQLGVAGVLFAGILVSSLARGLVSLPAEIHEIGLVVFVYLMGLQAGPGFFAAFGRRGLQVNLVTAGVIFFALGVITISAKVFHLPVALAAGIYCGATTNTPALAAVVDFLKRQGADSAPAVIGYSIIYPFALLGTLTTLHLFRRAWRVDVKQEVALVKRSLGQDSAVVSRNYRIEKDQISVGELQTRTGAVVSRIKRGNELIAPVAMLILTKGDVVVVVGKVEQHQLARPLLGSECDERLELQRDRLDYRRIFVSNAKVVGQAVGDLTALESMGATVTRIRRGDIEFVPSLSTVLEMGDRVRVVAFTERMNDVTEFFGDSMKAVSESELLSPAFGMVLGILLGMIPIPIPGAAPIRLGFAGGPMIVGLLLGKTAKTGPIQWSIPLSVNISLRQFGLLLFLAGVGVRAGETFVAQLMNAGPRLISVGVMTNLVYLTIAMLLFRGLSKLDFIRITGYIAGVQTQPAVLAAANTLTSSDLPNVAYATVFPTAMIAKIIAAQLIVSIIT